MKRTLLAISLALAGTSAQGADWDAADKVLLATALGSLGADWAQTRYIARNPVQFHETNPLLGSHPSVGKVNGYFALAAVGTVGISLALPPTYRKVFLGGVTLLEMSVVIRNNSIGIGMSF